MKKMFICYAPWTFGGLYLNIMSGIFMTIYHEKPENLKEWGFRFRLLNVITIMKFMRRSHTRGGSQLLSVPRIHCVNCQRSDCLVYIVKALLFEITSKTPTNSLKRAKLRNLTSIMYIQFNIQTMYKKKLIYFVTIVVCNFIMYLRQ